MNTNMNTDMKPQEVAAQLGVTEYMKLCDKVNSRYKQKFGVISIQRLNNGAIVEVALEDNTNHRVIV